MPQRVLYLLNISNSDLLAGDARCGFAHTAVPATKYRARFAPRRGLAGLLGGPRTRFVELARVLLTGTGHARYMRLCRRWCCEVVGDAGEVAVMTGVCWWVVVSAGRRLVVEVGCDFGDRWPALAGHVPATACHPASPALQPGLPRVRGRANWTNGDLRRWLNAQLHCLHLRHETVMAHAVTTTRAGRAVALLGGHGAGKSVVGLALAARGWQVAGGDLTLVRLEDLGAPVVVGGTTAYLVRASAVRCFFPDLPRPSSAGEKIDYSGRLPVTRTHQPPLREAVLVDIEGSGSGCAEEDLDAHTSATVWYRATGHALDRLLIDEAHADPLRLLESGDLARRRVRLARALARWVPVRRMRGDPQAIAAAVIERADRAERGMR